MNLCISLILNVYSLNSEPEREKKVKGPLL